MIGQLTFTLEGLEPITVTPNLGVLLAWEREHDASAAQLEEGRMSDVAWIAWKAWQRDPDREHGTMPYEAFEARLVDLDAEPADPSPAGATDESWPSS